MSVFKRLFLLSFVLFLSQCLCLKAKGAPSRSKFDNKLVLKIVGLSPKKGILRLALYDSKKNYTERKDPIRAVKVPVRDSNVTIEFEDLHPGDYAIMFYHDANSNDQFDTFLGLPLEQYGFSNNARPRFSAPEFERVRFKIPEKGTITMTLVAQ